MLAALASADPNTWISIVVKALAYASTLIAIGSVLVLLALPGVSERGRASLRRHTLIAVAAAAIFSGLRLPLRASFLMGGTLDGAVDGAVDPMILNMVAESPLGTSIAVRLAGLAMIVCIFVPGRIGRGLAILGAMVASLSFALRGHALSEPQMILGALITIHILGLSFWIGAFAPLSQSARLDPPEQCGALAHAFARQALWIVGFLVVAGAISLVLLGVATPAALTSAYGQMVLVKLLVFAWVLAIAARNKLSLTPALLAGVPEAAARLRRSIRLEALLIAGILIITATFTTISSPPSGMAG